MNAALELDLEKGPMYFNFDAGAVEFQGEKGVVKGSLQFDLPHEFRSPNWPAVQQIKVEVQNWLEKHLEESPDLLQRILPVLKLNALGVAYMSPEKYLKNLEDELSMRKGFWIGVMGVLEWFTDDLDDQETFRKDPAFKNMSKFFSSTMYKIFNYEFPSKAHLKNYVEEFGLFETRGDFKNVLGLWFDFSQEFVNDPLLKNSASGLNPRKMRLLGKVFEKQYASNGWMDGVGLEKVGTFHLYALRRQHSSGGLIQITMAAIMDGFHGPGLKYIFREQHVQHFTFLSMLIIGLVHELLSLKKELKAGETNNVVLIWVKTGKGLQDSINKTMRKHDQLVKEFKQLYNFLQREYENDPQLLGYLDLVMRNFSGACQFHVMCTSRYGAIKWSIDRVQNGGIFEQ